MSNIIQNIASNQFLVVKNPLQPRQELYISAADLNNDILSQDIVDALEAANDPSSTNAFVTINDLTATAITDLDPPVINQQNTPPGVPSLEDRYLVGTVPTGAWVGNANSVAEWDGLAWVYTVPVLDNVVYVTSTLSTLRFNGTSWVFYPGTAILNYGNSVTSPLRVGTKTNQLVYLIVNNTPVGRLGNASNTFVNPVRFGGAYTTSPDASAQVDISSTTKGVLVPRMTEAQKNAISSPATGLLIYQTNNTPGFYYFTGAVWTMLDSNASDWSLGGNTVGSLQNLGTTDAFDLPFITNNTERARILSTGEVGIGVTSPIAKLQMRGTNTSSGSYALIVENANPTTLFHIANDGGVFINGGVGNNETFGIRQVSGKNVIMDVYNNGFGRRHFTVFDNGGAGATDSYVSVGGRVADFPVATFYPAANANYGSLHLNSSGGNGYQLFSNRAGVSYNHVAFINGAGGGFTLVQNASQYYELQLQSFTGIGTNVLLSSDSTSYLGGIAAAQVGVGTGTPDASAKLEITSTTMGFRITPMTATQASAITPAEGLMVCVSDTDATFTSIGFWGYQNGAWAKM